MAEVRPGAEWVHVVVHVVLTTRAAIGLLLVVIDGGGVDPGATMSAVVALTIMTVYLGQPRRWHRAARSIALPLLDSLLAVVVLMTFGSGGWALGYVVATVFLWALGERRAPWLIALTGPVTLYLVLGLADLLLGQVQESLAWGVRMLIVILGVPAAARTRTLLHRYRVLEQELREERRRVAQAEERTRLSVEMHDSVAKSLHGIHLMSAHLASTLEAEGHPIATQVETLRDSAEQARVEARELVAGRRVVVDSEPHLALADAVRTWQSSQPEVQVRTQIDPFELGSGAAHELLAAVGEVLENIARHARATTVTVAATQSEGWVRVTFADDGVGMSSTRTGDWVARGHFGVDGVARRLSRVRGRAHFDSSPGRGTRVVLTIPAHVPDPDGAQTGNDGQGDGSGHAAGQTGTIAVTTGEQAR